MTSYLSQTWPWCAEMPLHLRNIITGVRVGFFPRKNYFVLFDGIKNVTIADPLYLGTCDWWVMFVPRLGLKSKYFVHVNESTVLTGLHIFYALAILILHVKWTLVRWYIFVHVQQLISWIYIDDTGQSGVVCKGTVYVPGVSLSGFISFYHTCCIPLFKQHWPQLLLDHKHTMNYWVFVNLTINTQWTTEYLLVASTYIDVPLTVNGGLLV